MIPGARRGLHGQLGLAVAVEVVDHELRVVRAGADVLPQVDAPQPPAVELVRVQVDVAGAARLRVVLGVGGIPLEDELVLSVTVEIAAGDRVTFLTAGGGGTVNGSDISELILMEGQPRWRALPAHVHPRV